MTSKEQKSTDLQVGESDQDTAPSDMTMEQMFLAMMRKQSETEMLMPKIMEGQQTLENELEKQRKEIDKGNKSTKRTMNG